jgi:glycosyltransferase involved in cell wall biosynthesis
LTSDTGAAKHGVVAPRVSVVVRSYNRLPALCELLDVLLGQDHDSFEVVVVDQSTQHPAEATARLAELERDPRLRVLRFPPLGGARARNTGVAAARGGVVVLVDDDDLPVGSDFLRLMEAPFREDPALVGVTCRHYWGDQETISPVYRALARRRCMRFSPLLRLPWTYPRLDEAVARVDYVHGTGGAYRRDVFARFGGWDDDTPIEDETSLGIRVGRGLTGGERIAFDPRPRLRRRMDVDGGLAKRKLTPARFYARFMTFVHHILGRYYPTRLRALYPLYVLAGLQWTVSWIWADSQAHDTVARKLLGTVGFAAALPYHAWKAMREPLGTRPGAGEALAESMRTPA